MDKQVEENKSNIHDNAVGWKIATCIAVLALVYSVLSNRQQDMTLEHAQTMLYEHLTGMKDPIHD